MGGWWLFSLLGFILGAAVVAAYSRWGMMSTNVLRSLRDGVLILDNHYVIRWMSRSLETYLDIEAHQFIGKPYSELMKQFEVDDNALANPDNPRFEIVHNNRIMEPVTSIIRNPLGSEMGRVLIFYDVTKRTNAERAMESRMSQINLLRRIHEELSSTLDIDVLMSYAMDSVLRVSHADVGFIAMYESLQDTNKNMRLKLIQHIGPHDTDKLQRYLDNPSDLLANALNSRQPQCLAPTDAQTTAIQQPKTVALMVLPLHSSKNQVAGVIYLETRDANNFNDETYQFMQLLSNRIMAALENARLYRSSLEQLEALWESHSKIATLEHLKTGLIRVADHDLRNPLNALMLHITVLERVIKKDPDRAQKTVIKIKAAAERMKRLIEDILSLDYIERIANTPPVLFNVVKVTDLLNEVRGQYLPEIDAKNQTIVLDIYGNGSCMIHGDEKQLIEALGHILRNAIQYTPENGHIRIQAQQVNDMCQIVVTDDGCGIPPESLQSVFEPFYRIKQPKAPQVSGTGLGLYVVQNIVKRHHGTVNASSSQSGTTITLRLPITKND